MNKNPFNTYFLPSTFFFLLLLPSSRTQMQYIKEGREEERRSISQHMTSGSNSTFGSTVMYGWYESLRGSESVQLQRGQSCMWNPVACTPGRGDKGRRWKAEMKWYRWIHTYVHPQLSPYTKIHVYTRIVCINICLYVCCIYLLICLQYYTVSVILISTARGSV